MDVNRYVSNQRFVGLAAINLDNVYPDASMLRDPIAMKIFARLGVPAPRQAHARLFVNDVYSGVYVIVEPVDRTFVSRVYGEAEGELESGGYLFEYRWIDEYDFSYMGPSLAAYVGMFRAQTRDTDSMSSLYAPIEGLIRTINDTPSDRFATEVGRMLDLPQLARFLGIQNCMAELDGFAGYYGANNFSLYRFRDGRPAVVIPWDADNALSSPDMPLGYRLSTNVLARRMMEVPVLRADLRRRGHRMRADPSPAGRHRRPRVAGAGDRSAVGEDRGVGAGGSIRALQLQRVRRGGGTTRRFRASSPRIFVVSGRRLHGDRRIWPKLPGSALSHSDARNCHNRSWTVGSLSVAKACPASLRRLDASSRHFWRWCWPSSSPPTSAPAATDHRRSARRPRRSQPASAPA